MGDRDISVGSGQTEKLSRADARKLKRIDVLRKLRYRTLEVNVNIKGDPHQQDENAAIEESTTPTIGARISDVRRRFKELLGAKKRSKENLPNDCSPSTSKAIMPRVSSPTDSTGEPGSIKTEKEAESETQTEAVMKAEETSEEGYSGAPLTEPVPLDEEGYSGVPLTEPVPLDKEWYSGAPLTEPLPLDEEWYSGAPLTEPLPLDEEWYSGAPLTEPVPLDEEWYSGAPLTEPLPLDEEAAGPSAPPSERVSLASTRLSIHIPSSSEESLCEKAPKLSSIGNKTAAFKILADRLKTRASARLSVPAIDQLITDLYNLGYNFPNHIDVATRPVSQWTRHQMMVELGQEHRRQKYVQESLCDMGQCTCHSADKVMRFSPDVKRCMTGEDEWRDIDALVVHLSNFGYFLPMYIDLRRPISQLARQQIRFELRQEVRRQRHIELCICEAGFATEEDDIMLSEENEVMLSEENEEDECQDVGCQDIQALVVNLKNAGYQFPAYLDLHEPVSQLTWMKLRFEMRQELERLRSIERYVCEAELACLDRCGQEECKSMSTLSDHHLQQTSSIDSTESCASYETAISGALSFESVSFVDTVSMNLESAAALSASQSSFGIGSIDACAAIIYILKSRADLTTDVRATKSASSVRDRTIDVRRAASEGSTPASNGVKTILPATVWSRSTSSCSIRSSSSISSIFNFSCSSSSWSRIAPKASSMSTSSVKVESISSTSTTSISDFVLVNVKSAGLIHNAVDQEAVSTTSTSATALHSVCSARPSEIESSNITTTGSSGDFFGTDFEFAYIIPEASSSGSGISACFTNAVNLMTNDKESEGIYPNTTACEGSEHDIGTEADATSTGETSPEEAAGPQEAEAAAGKKRKKDKKGGRRKRWWHVFTGCFRRKTSAEENASASSSINDSFASDSEETAIA